MPWSGRTWAVPLHDSSVIRLIRPRRRHYVALGWVRSVGPAGARENEEDADGAITRIRPWTGSSVYDRRPDCHPHALGVGVLQLLENPQQSDLQRLRPEVPVHARDDREGDA